MKLEYYYIEQKDMKKGKNGALLLQKGEDFHVSKYANTIHLK